jgi:hypothetical protein
MDSPHEQVGGGPSAKAFIGGVLQGFACVLARNEIADVPLPNKVGGVVRDKLRDGKQVAQDKFWNTGQVPLPPRPALNAGCRARKHGVEPKLAAHGEIDH